jgi:hypothetical protein
MNGDYETRDRIHQRAFGTGDSRRRDNVRLLIGDLDGAAILRASPIQKHFKLSYCSMRNPLLLRTAKATLNVGQGLARGGPEGQSHGKSTAISETSRPAPASR